MLAPVLLAAALAPAHYTVSMPDPPSHFFHVEVRYGDVSGPLRFAFPAFTPGGWKINEIAGNVLGLSAADGADHPLAATKTDKETWSIAKPADGTVVVRYRVYADEKGTPYVARLNGDVAQANLAAILGYAPDRQQDPARLTLSPAPGWKVACSLAEAGDAPGVFTAPDFDQLADGIFLAGAWSEQTFTSGGTRFRMVFWRPPEFKDRKVVDDVRGIVREAASVFGATPFDRFLFIYLMEPDGARGGIEHLYGTSIAQPLDAFTDREIYVRFLGVTAHEFVHAWNVKRMRPAGLGPFDYTREALTHNLYVAEGFTSYYGPLTAVRSGAMKRDEFFKNLADNIVTDRDNVGIREKALQDHSWDWWLDSAIPYLSFRTNYTRGAFVALALDLEIRAATGGKRSLDDAMRALYEKTGLRATGYTDTELRETLAKAGAAGMDAKLDAWVTAPGPLDVPAALARAGLEVVPDPETPAVPFTGWRSATAGKDFPSVDWVEPGSPAARAGLESRDLLVALSDRRLSGENLSKEAGRLTPGTAVTVTFFRDGVLKKTEIVPGQPVPPKLIVRPKKDASAAEKAFLEAWLSPRASGATP